TVTPYGIFLPELDELFLYFTESKVTSDFIVDVIADFWEREAGAICEQIQPKLLSLSAPKLK
ncbi:MAG: hypothetical protein F6K14_25490, partial [Symploca sp. SIO2C1]|nr:hypothetical protein [Symploca sp. SIO2C1]